MSIGLALIFGVMRVVNFAQGDFMMLGMYLTYFYAMSGGVDPLLGAILTIPPFFVLGFIVQRGLLARVTGGGDPQRQMDAQLILTLGLSLVITNAATMILTPTPRGIRTTYATQAFALGPILLNQARSYAFAMALVLAAAVYLFLTRTDLGKALRAAADDPEAASYQGIDVRAMHGLGIAAIVAAGRVLALVIEERYHHRVLTLVFLWAAMGLAWNIISGYAGQISFGHQVFFGIGAYVTVLLVVKAGLTPWIGMGLAVAVAVLAAVLIGLPTFRLGGIYFGLATLAYPLIFRIVMDWLGYQEVAVPMIRERPAWFMQFSAPRSFDLLALGVLAATLVLSRAIETSRLGYRLGAVGGGGWVVAEAPPPGGTRGGGAPPAAPPAGPARGGPAPAARPAPRGGRGGPKAVSGLPGVAGVGEGVRGAEGPPGGHLGGP